MLLEISAEIGLRCKVQHIGYLCYAVSAALYKQFGFTDDVVVNVITCIHARGFINELRKVFRSDTEFVGIKSDATFCCVVFLHQLDEAIEDFFLSDVGIG